MSFTKNHRINNKRKFSLETRKKMSLAKMGKKRPDMVGNTWNVGRIVSKHERELKRKIMLKNPVRFFLGKKLTEEHRKKLCGRVGDKSSNWKGDKISYPALHMWVKRMFGSPDKCEHCSMQTENKRKIHWANKSHKYKRVRSDWMRLCVRCHRIYDKHPFYKNFIATT